MPGSFLAEFELYVTMAVARLGPEAYGTAVRREIESRTGRPVAVGAIYTTIARLEKKGLMTTRASQPEPGQRGRPRKYCSLTRNGEEALQHTLDMLGRMADGLTIGSTGSA